MQPLRNAVVATGTRGDLSQGASVKASVRESVLGAQSTDTETPIRTHCASRIGAKRIYLILPPSFDGLRQIRGRWEKRGGLFVPRESLRLVLRANLQRPAHFPLRVVCTGPNLAWNGDFEILKLIRNLGPASCQLIVQTNREFGPGFRTVFVFCHGTVY